VHRAPPAGGLATDLPAGLPDGRLPDRAGRLPARRELLPHVRAQAGPPRQLPRDLRAEPRAVRAGSARPPQERRSLGAYRPSGGASAAATVTASPPLPRTGRR